MYVNIKEPGFPQVDAMMFDKDAFDALVQFTGGRISRLSYEANQYGEINCYCIFNTGKIVNTGDYVVKHSDEDYTVMSQSEFKTQYAKIVE